MGMVLRSCSASFSVIIFLVLLCVHTFINFLFLFLLGMGKILAMSGLHIAKPKGSPSSTPFDKEVIRLTAKKRPSVLFIPTAADDSDSYIDAFTAQYRDRLGCHVDFLLLHKEKYTKAELRKKILGADIIYVGGGNTLRMLLRWRRLGVDDLLRQAFKKDIVLCGVSAGAICWCRFGNSDSRKFTSNSEKLIRVTGLGFLPFLFCPHYTTEPHRRSDLKRMMRFTPGVALALDDACAFEFVDGKWRIFSAKKTAKARRIYYKRGVYQEELLPITKDFWSLDALLKR